MEYDYIECGDCLELMNGIPDKSIDLIVTDPPYLISYKTNYRKDKRLTDVWMFNRVSGKSLVHQNQKPVELIEQCILKHSNEGDIVFDGFLGSGTTAVACVNTNRHYIGFELDPQYYDIACKRLDEAEGVANGTV